MQMESAIDQEIQKVCPIDGMSFGKLDDKTTWEINFSKEATPEQIAAAEKVIAEFNWDADKQEAMRKQDRDAEHAMRLECRYCFVLYQERNPAATFSEFMDYLETLTV